MQNINLDIGEASQDEVRNELVLLASSLPRIIQTDLSDLVTMMALTDSGPNVAEQPSKLWTTRTEFQRSRAPHNPTAIHPIPITEAQRSLRTIINSARPVCKERKQNLIAAVGQRVQAATVTLAVPSLFDMENAEHVIEMRAKVDEAALVAMSARKSLERVEDSSEKTAVISSLRALETRIDFIGSTLPPETAPFLFDSCKFLILILAFKKT